MECSIHLNPFHSLVKTCCRNQFVIIVLSIITFKHLLTSSLNTAGNHSYYTRRNKKGLLFIPYSRTVTESKSVKNRLRQAYNWLKVRDLIPKDIKRLSNSQISLQLKKIRNFIS